MLMLTINEKCCVLYCLYFLYYCAIPIIDTNYLKYPKLTKINSYYFHLNLNQIFYLSIC